MSLNSALVHVSKFDGRCDKRGGINHTPPFAFRRSIFYCNKDRYPCAIYWSPMAPGLDWRSRDGRHKRHFKRIYSSLSIGRYRLVLLAITTTVSKMHSPLSSPSEISKICFLYRKIFLVEGPVLHRIIPLSRTLFEPDVRSDKRGL